MSAASDAATGEKVLQENLTPNGSRVTPGPALTQPARKLVNRKKKGKGASKSQSAQECVHECVKCIFDLLAIFGYKAKDRPTEESKAATRWMKLTDECKGDWMKVAKYKLAAFYVSHAADECSCETPNCAHLPTLPKRPFEGKDQPKVLVGGRAGRFIASFLNPKHHTKTERLEFLTSVLQAKKGFPRPSKEKVDATVEEFVETITAVKEQARGVCLFPTWGDIPVNASFAKSEAFLSEETMKRQLRRTVREVFEGHEFTDVDRVRPFFPSTSANYINTRAKGGAVGVLLQDPEILRGLRRKGGFLDKSRVSERKFDDEEENRGEDAERIDLEQPALFETFRILWLRIAARALHESNDVEPVGLAEALKVRVITKGPPYRMTMLRSMWKFIHTVLRRHPAFALIGAPVTEEYLLDRLGRVLRPGEKFLSGDYKAATDNLHSWVSRTIAEELADCMGITEFERQILIEALTEHTVRGKKQARGQLMGSIVSFPVLCLANACMTRWAHEVATERSWTLRDCPAMFNGDDVLLKTTAVGRSVWAKITAFGGLEESVGKTFFERGYANINSQNFEFRPEAPLTIWKKRVRSPEEIETLQKHSTSRIDPVSLVQRECPFVRVKYVNMGLLRGLKRSGAARAGLGDLDDPFANLGARYRDMISAAPEWAREGCHNSFVNANSELLEKCRPIPWHVPEWLGGLGLTGLKEPSDLDRQLAQTILCNWSKKRPIRLGRKEAGWATWKLANAELPKPYTSTLESESTRDWDRLVGLKVVDLLFDSRVKIDTLLKAVKDNSTTKAAVRHNAKLWTPGNYKRIAGTGLTNEQMLFHKKFDSMVPEDPLETLRLEAAHRAAGTLD